MKSSLIWLTLIFSALGNAFSADDLPRELSKYKRLYETSKESAVMTDFDFLDERSNHVCEWVYSYEGSVQTFYSGISKLIIRRSRPEYGPIKIIASYADAINSGDFLSRMMDEVYHYSQTEKTSKHLYVTMKRKSGNSDRASVLFAQMELRKTGDAIVFKAMMPLAGTVAIGYGSCAHN